MKVIAQSQPPVTLSYIHLAYTSAALENKISKGELLPAQALVAVAVACALVCAVIGAKLGRGQGRLRAANIAAFVGFFASLGLLWLAEAAWSDSRSDEAVVKHVIQTKQYWAMRDARLAAGIEAAAGTNGTAASMAANYYGLKGISGRETAELRVKGYRFSELAAAQGQPSQWSRASDLTNTAYAGHLVQMFEVALKEGKLTQTEQTWARRQLASMTAQLEDPAPAQQR
jgi:hypothetical protein